MRILLDTCVLFPHLTRGLLLGVAKYGAFTPLWSDKILNEWRATGRKHHAEAEANISISLANADFPSACVSNVEPRDDLSLPDMDDTHVLGAALQGQADAILTLNIRDFPIKTLGKYGLLRFEPDAFLQQELLENRDQMTALLLSEIAKIPDGPRDLDGARPLLKKARLSRFAKAL